MSEGVMDRAGRDEHALVLFSRMLSRRPVWVDSPAGQMTWVNMIGLDADGEVVVYDHEGNDRRAEDYLLVDPERAGTRPSVTRRQPYVFDPDWCMSPGVILAEMIDNAGLSRPLGVVMVARLAGLTPSTVEGILDASVEITPDIAAHLAAGTSPLSISAQFWLNAERIYRAGLKAGKIDVSGDYAPDREDHQ